MGISDSYENAVDNIACMNKKCSPNWHHAYDNKIDNMHVLHSISFNISYPSLNTQSKTSNTNYKRCAVLTKKSDKFKKAKEVQDAHCRVVKQAWKKAISIKD